MSTSMGARDAFSAMRRLGLGGMVTGAAKRLIDADAFAFARGLAFQMALTALPGFIAVIGLTSKLGDKGISKSMRKTLFELTPGSTSRTVESALKQGSQLAGAEFALGLGLVATLTAAAMLMVQLETAANRIYGLEAKAPIYTRYLRGMLLAITAGLFWAGAYVLFVAGSGFASGFLVWARWPLAVALVLASYTVVVHVAPARRAPSIAWTLAASTGGVVVWSALTVLLSLYLTLAQGFGQFYGPLAGMIGLLVWAYLGAVAILIGIALATELEES